MGLDLSNEEIAFLDKCLEFYTTKDATDRILQMVMTLVTAPSPKSAIDMLGELRKRTNTNLYSNANEEVLLLRAKLLMYSREKKEEQLKKQAEAALNNKQV